MNKDKTAVFIGHGDCPLLVEDIKPFIEQEIRNGVECFLSGGQGSFDRICARAVYNLKSKYPDVKNILVIPYTDFKIFDKSLFDEILSPNIGYESSIAYKSAIPKRNQWMVKNASTAICYIAHISGGAYKTYKLAEKEKHNITNVSYIK